MQNIDLSAWFLCRIRQSNNSNTCYHDVQNKAAAEYQRQMKIDEGSRCVGGISTVWKKWTSRLNGSIDNVISCFNIFEVFCGVDEEAIVRCVAME